MDIYTTNSVQFRTIPIDDLADLYEWEVVNPNPPVLVTTQIPYFRVNYKQTGVGVESQLRVCSLRTDAEGTVIGTSPWSEPSDPFMIIPVPEPGGVLLVAGLLFLCLLGRKRKP